MSNTSLIIGESGTGKSTSIRNLEPSETFIINVLNKPLPFRGYKKHYTRVSPDGMTGNYYASDVYEHIELVIKKINAKRPEIKTLILDDFQYLMANEFMNRALERGYDKFSEIGKHAHDLLKMLPTLRDDLDVFILTHSESNEQGKMKIKTIGKMLDEKITIEGMYAMVLQTELMNGTYNFITQGDARHIAKSPMGMFEERNIPNDLAFVKQKMSSYYNEGIA
jgi:RNase adaptor protein for sRNA GlmZ degradation